MKRYNMSEIMTQAWRRYKLTAKTPHARSFGDCLRSAWTIAKYDVQQAEKAAKRASYIANGHLSMLEGRIDGHNVTLSDVWCNVTGDTYKIKNILKKYSLQWNPYERQWEGDPQQIRALAYDYMY